MKRNIFKNIISHSVNAAVCVLLASAVLISCEKKDPYDTQSPDDAPLILKPYNESGTGSFTYTLANPETPLLDSVTVTPSAYTTVNWYLERQLVHTGFKINMCFLAGKYALTIEAVTTAGKRTYRTGTVTVKPNAADPYSEAPAGGRHTAPKSNVSITGSNLSSVAEVEISKDVFGVKVLQTVTPSAVTASQIDFTLPEMEDGAYFIRLKDATGKRYGADMLNVHTSPVVLDGYKTFSPGKEWVITGLMLQNVKSVQVGDNTITTLTATETSVTFTAPNLELGKYTLSMKNEDGSAVQFATADGMVKEVTVSATLETTLWTGPVVIDWNADLVKVDAATMAQVPVGATILVYFNIPDAEYHAMRITTPWWDGYDLVGQMDGFENYSSPFSFTYTDDCKTKVETCGAMSVVGFGVNVLEITFK